MNNRENYQRTFDIIQAPERIIMEDKILNHKKRIYISRFAVILIATLFIMASSSVVYANNIGGIKRTIQVWVHGDQTSVTFDLDKGTYQGVYQNQNGEIKEVSGGGVASNPDGSVRPVNEEELLEHLNAPYVEYFDDGTIWLFYYDQKMEITDKFNDDGVCFVLLQYKDENVYVTVKRNGGMSSSKKAYIQPYEFN